LMRQSANSAGPETVASNVLAYDFASDGSVIHTNGVDVYVLPSGGGSGYKLLSGADIESLVTV